MSPAEILWNTQYRWDRAKNNYHVDDPVELKNTTTCEQEIIKFYY